MWDDQAADIDEDIQGNSTSDLPPSNVMPMAEDLVEESISRKANAVTICFLTILLKWFCRYNIGINAINTLLIILHFYFLILKQFSPLLASISFIFPKSLRSLQNILRVNRNSFIKFIVCPECHSIYNLDNLLTSVENVCTYCEYPQHPHRARRKPCGTKLVAKIKLKDGSLKLYPHKCIVINLLQNH